MAGDAEPMTDPVRHRLSRLIEERQERLAGLSRLLGRNPAWMQQFMERGTPRKLPEDDRLTLAKYFGVDERELGAREPWRPGA